MGRIIAEALRRRSGTEEAVQSVNGLFGSLFREKVPAVESASLNIVAPDAPERDRSSFLDIPGIKQSLCAPQGQERADDPTPARAIGRVMLAIDRRGGAVL